MSNKKLAASLLLLSVLNCGCGDDVTEVIMVSPSLYQIHESFVMRPHGVVRRVLQCNDGDLATGGGYFLYTSELDPGDLLVEVFANAPSTDLAIVGTGWDIGIKNKAAIERNGFAFVICLVDALSVTP